jgi:hypothetical protein
VELGHTGDTIADATPTQDHPTFVEHTDVVVGLGPVHADKDHLLPPPPNDTPQPEEFRSDLMVKCSRHATPPAVDLLTDQQGHSLAIELEARVRAVLPCWRLGDQPARRPN